MLYIELVEDCPTKHRHLHHLRSGRLSDDHVVRVEAQVISLDHAAVIGFFGHDVQQPHICHSFVREVLQRRQLRS